MLMPVSVHRFTLAPFDLRAVMKHIEPYPNLSRNGSRYITNSILFNIIRALWDTMEIFEMSPFS